MGTKKNKGGRARATLPQVSNVCGDADRSSRRPCSAGWPRGNGVQGEALSLDGVPPNTFRAAEKSDSSKRSVLFVKVIDDAARCRWCSFVHI